MVFEKLTEILGEPIEITEDHTHRWKLGNNTFTVKPRGEDFSHVVHNDRGENRGGCRRCTPERLIEAAWSFFYSFERERKFKEGKEQ